MDFALKSVGPTEVVDTQQKNCSNCSMHQLCLPTDLNECDTQRLSKIIIRRKIHRDAFLYRVGDKFTSLYAVRIGHFKSYQENLAGERQVTGFPMTGELLGMDAIDSEHHQCDAVALDDSDVCIVPFKALEALFVQMPPLLHHFHRILSQEITSEQKVISFLGNMRAEQRFAAFLLNLSGRYAARGYSSTQFQLRMTREDIANYLGLTIESISRIIAKMRNDGIIHVQQREVEVLDLPRLRKLATGIDTLGINSL